MLLLLQPYCQQHALALEAAFLLLLLPLHCALLLRAFWQEDRCDCRPLLHGDVCCLRCCCCRPLLLLLIE
jgi:hypothetical protein